MVKVDKKSVALTFDDGPNQTYSLEVLKLLEKYHAKATFFYIGNQIEANLDVVEQVVAKGHEIGNHTWSHPDLTKISPEEVKQEIESTSEVIKKSVGKAPVIFRPPYGEINDQVESMTELSPVLWEVDSEDWRTQDPDEIYQLVTDNVEDGSIVLLHEIHQGTVDALDRILKFLVDANYQFVTVSELNR